MDRTVCIIDDDEDVRGVMCFALEFEGIKAISFSGGAEAEAQLSKMTKEEYPCMIVVDYMMPEMDGIEFIKRIYENYPDTLAKIPMALSTARFSDETTDLPEGAIRLEKPVDLESFITLVKSCSEPSSDELNSPIP